MLRLDTQPGMALARLAHGTQDAATVAIRHALAGATDPLHRVRLLLAAGEILLAGGDWDGAGAAGVELVAIVDDHDTTGLCAMAAQATGAVRLGEGVAEEALTALRQARPLCTTWTCGTRRPGRWC